MTTAATINAIANSTEFNPVLRDTATTDAVTKDEWELGIPPAPNNLSLLNLLVLIKHKIVLIICAAAHEIIAETKI